MNPMFTYAKPDRRDIALGRATQSRVLASLPLSGNKKKLNEMKRQREEGIGGRRAPSLPVATRLKNILTRSEMVASPANFACAKSFIEEALTNLETEGYRSEMADLVAATRGEGPDASLARATLAMRIAISVGHLIRAAGTWVQWYQSVSLAEDEVPYLRNYVPQNVNVRIGTADGTLMTHDAQPDLEDDTKAQLFFVLSDLVRAKLFDEEKGRIADAALGTVDIALDIMEKIDGLLQLPFLVGTPNSVYVSSFTNDGTPASHYHASSRIQTGNFPAGNIIAPATNGAATLPRFDCVRAIDEYFGRFGDNFQPDGEMAAARIHVASGLAHHFGSEFNPTSHVNRYTENMFQNRRRIEYNGLVYDVVPDPTIDPADKHIYVSGGMPAGLFFDKAAGSMNHRHEDEIQNEVSVFQRQLIAMLFPVTYAPRVLAVKFKT